MRPGYFKRYSITLAVVMVIFTILSSCSFGIEDKVVNSSPGHIGFEPLPVSDIAFYSESLKREMHINVVLPRGYEDSGIDYPTLYLCHGFSSNYHEFEYVGVPEYLNRFDMIVVMVDVGNSWYVNWAESEDGRSLNFADHVCIDVINYVDKNYRTVADRKGRAINGISMGGFGGMSLGLSHPELFCSVGSHSGALSFAKGQSIELAKKAGLEEEEENNGPSAFMSDTTMHYRGIDIEGFSTMKDRSPLGKPFLRAEDADRVDPFKLVLEIPVEELPHIYLDCGTGDFLYGSAREFMQHLLDNKIPFQYGQSAGTHEEDYWGRELSTSMAVQYSVMLRNIWGKEFERYDAWTN